MSTQLTPILVPNLDPTDETFLSSRGDAVNLFGQPLGQRIFAHNGALYALYISDENYPTNILMRVSRSTDNGDTWATMDSANEYDINDPLASTRNEVTLQFNNKIYIAIDRYTGVSSAWTGTVKVYSFDLSTNAWDLTTITGPSVSGGTFDTRQYMSLRMISRGLSEILLLYNKPNFGVSSFPCYIDIYNIGSSTWTSTAHRMFAGLGSFRETRAADMVYDGSYVHIIAAVSSLSGSEERLHVTFSSGNAFGTEVNVLSSYISPWPDPTTTVYQEYNNRIEGIVHGGRVYFIQDALFSPPAQKPNSIIVWSTPVGAATGSFTAETILYDVSPTNNFSPWCPKPLIVNGTLYVAALYWFGGIALSTKIVFSKKLSTGWTAFETFYDYAVEAPDGSQPLVYLGPAPKIYDFSAIPFSVGSGSGFAALSTMRYSNESNPTTFFVKDSPCPPEGGGTSIAGNYMY
jgi:hypothetical protein